MIRFLITIAFLLFEDICFAEAVTHENICNLSNHVNIDYFLNKNYQKIPKFGRAMPPGGNVRYEKFWEVGRDDLLNINVIDDNVEVLGFTVYKDKIYGISIHFTEDAIFNKRVNIDNLMAFCGNPITDKCTELNKSGKIMTKQNNFSLIVTNAKIESRIYGYRYNSISPCL